MLATAFASALDLLAAARGASVARVPESRKSLASEMSKALDLGLLQRQTKGGAFRRLPNNRAHFFGP